MKKIWIMANWKMNGSRAMVKNYVEQLNLKYQKKINQNLVVLAPNIYLPYFEMYADKDKYTWGAQNIGPEKLGAFTGETSAEMVKEYGARYVLVGHSERRHIFKEEEKILAKKFYLVQECGMIPVFCIGETLEQYQAGQTKQILEMQLRQLKPFVNKAFKNVMIAYEPVWAIGSGLTPTVDEIEQTLLSIKKILVQLEVNEADVPILYGGSVSERNAQLIIEIEACQGVLVGGAALKVEQLLEITQCIICC